MNSIAKKLSKEIVKETALELMYQNFTTNSLQVKTTLRSKGYDARQENVTRIMNEIAQEEFWNFTVKNKYKVYWK